MRTVPAVIAFAFVTGVAVAQQPPAPFPGQPVSNVVPVGAAEPVTLPPGQPVSQPLTPVVEPEPMPAAGPVVVPDTTEVEVKLGRANGVRGPLGPGWSSMELLYWWPARQPVPALVASPGAVIVGGQSLDNEPSGGGRFTTGSSLNSAQTGGYEIVYFFLGTRTYRQNVASVGPRAEPTFGLPYANPTTGATELLLLAQPGMTDSLLTVSTSVRVQGWEVNAVSNLHDGPNLRVNGLLGWRYFQAHEGLRIEQRQIRYVGVPGAAMTADQFDAHNRFHGGQVGLHADFTKGFLFCEVTAKVAFGQTYEVVKQEGATHLFAPGSARTFGGSGIYVQPSNAGRMANGVFAVLPEGTCKFGFRLGDSGRLYLGYSFLYLSDAVRPGDQIDRTLFPGQVPLVSGMPPVYGGDRPRPMFNRSDFWVQGLIIGLETRY